MRISPRGIGLGKASELKMHPKLSGREETVVNIEMDNLSDYEI